MKKIINILKITVLSVVLGACSSDDNITNEVDNITNEDTNINKVVYYGSDYEINYFEYTSFGQYINFELYNKSASEVNGAYEIGGEALKNVDYYYISLEDTVIQQKTYNLDEIRTVYFVLNGDIEYGDIDGGVDILSTKSETLKPTSGTVIVTNVTPTDIEFSFEFTRADGELITGKYKGDNNYKVSGR